MALLNPGEVSPWVRAAREDYAARERAALSTLGPLPPSLEEFWTTIRLPDGWEPRVKVVRPKDLSGTHALIVLWYGGAFAMGSPDALAKTAWQFAETLGAVVVMPTHKHIPEHPWPAPMRSGWETLVYLSRHAETELGATLDGPGGGFVVGGVSSGATIAGVAAGISILGDAAVREHGIEALAKPITGAYLHSGVLVTPKIVPDAYRNLWTSREDNRDSPSIGTATVDMVVATLAPDETSQWFSPLNTILAMNAEQIPSERRPRFLFHEGGIDCLRDDGVVLAKVLEDRGFESKVQVFAEDSHAAWIMFPWESKAQDPSLGEAAVAEMRWLLRL